MAFATHWRTEFDDIHGVTWKVDIQEDGYGGSVVDLKATGNPLRIEYLSESDEFNEPIRPSKAMIGVYSTTDFALLSLYSDADFTYKVIIYYESTVYWQGFIDTANYQEPYEEPIYEVTVTATDGLSYLKNIMYDDAGAYYTGRKFESKIILDILDKIEIAQFTEYVNIYEESMNDTVDDSPLDQTKIDVEVFQNISCYEVLTEILKTYNAVIIQKGGEMCIIRPKELTGATVYGRAFTAETTKTSDDYAPVQYINRTVNTSDLIQTRGSVLMIKRAVKDIVVDQDYGDRESWIKNYDIRPDSYISNDSEFQYWTAGAGWSRTSIAGVDRGILLAQTGGTTPPSGANYVQQSFGPFAVNCSDSFIFSFEYLTRNTSGSTISSVNFYIRIKSDTANQYLKVSDAELYVWDTSAAIINVQIDVPTGVSGWATFSRKIASLPTAGSYTITIWGLDSATACQIVYNNLKFYSTADAILQGRSKTYSWPWGFLTKWKRVYKYVDNVEIIRKQYALTNSVAGGKVELQYMLGDVADANIDNVLEQFKGSLMTYVTKLFKRVDTVTLSGTSGEAGIVCNGVSRTAAFATDLATTASIFVSDNAVDYLPDVIVTNSGNDIIFTAATAGDDFTGATTITNSLGDLSGPVVNTTPASTTTIDHSTDWNTRGGSESTQLISIIANEIKNQYARPKQFISMNIQESDSSAPVLNIIGRIEDEINQVSGNNRKFVFVAGDFDVKKRRWKADLIEIL